MEAAHLHGRFLVLKRLKNLPRQLFANGERAEILNRGLLNFLE